MTYAAYISDTAKADIARLKRSEPQAYKKLALLLG